MPLLSQSYKASVVGTPRLQFPQLRTSAFIRCTKDWNIYTPLQFGLPTSSIIWREHGTFAHILQA